VDVDYTFVPGSMLSRQKDAVKNEMLELLKQGLVSHAEVRKYLPTATPDVFRLSYDLQEAAARRMLQTLKRAVQPTVPTMEPWQDPQVFAGVLEEFMLTAAFEDPQLVSDGQRKVIAQAWQAYKVKAEQAAMAMAQRASPGLAAGAAAAQPSPAAMDPGSVTPTTGAESMVAGPAEGALSLEDAADSAMSPPG
jgi:hypothetical protein